MKTFKLLIGYDGSACSKSALHELVKAGLPSRVEVRVLSVADLFLPEGPDAIDPQLPESFKRPIRQARVKSQEHVDKAYATALEGGAWVKRHFPEWSVRGEASPDTPSWALVKMADQWKPDLVLVGCHGRSALGRFLVGSVSQTVLTHVSCSVRVAHHDVSKRTTPPRVIIGFDGSVHSFHAVQQVAGRSWPKGTVIKLISVLDLKMSVLLKTEKAQHVWLKQVMRPAADLLRQADLRVIPVVRDGDPKEVLLQEVKRWKADCLFVGARGLTSIKRFLLGSVSSAVANQAACTVEVVRRHLKRG